MGGQFIGIYLRHFGFWDGLIAALGSSVLAYQIFMWHQSRTVRLPNQGPTHDQFRIRFVWTMRIATLAVDGLPLLGLLGTVTALLVTFAGMGGVKLDTNIVASFAPGLTSTITGIFFALANLAVLSLMVQPIATRFKGQ